MKLLLDVNLYLKVFPSQIFHEVISEWKLVLEDVSISHVMKKTSNSRYNRYKYSGLFLKPKILLYAEIPSGFKILFFTIENMFFLIYG